MSQIVTQGSTDLLGTVGIHEGVDPMQWDLGFYVGQFPGVIGETHIIDKNKGRDLMLLVRYRGFETAAELETAMALLESYQGLDGDVTIDDQTFENCTLVVVRRVEKKFLDGSGVHGWTCKYLLQWRQREPNESP